MRVKQLTKGKSMVTKLTLLKKKIDKRQMIRPEQLRNFIYNNSLQDWLESFYNEKPKSVKLPRNHQKDFRLKVQEAIHKITSLGVVLDRPDIKDMNGIEAAKVLNGSETLEQMKLGTPIIFNAQLINRSEAICDIADMLIRSDYVPILFKDYHPAPGSCKFGSWYYIVVGIRFSTLTFCVDGLRLRNDPSTKFWKTKLYMQSRILNTYQHYDSCRALLIGKGYTWTKSAAYGNATVNGTKFFDKIGEIQFDNWDEFTDTTYETGVDWLNTLSQPDASKWVIEPTPSKPELYANAKLSIYDTPWAPVINQLAVKQDDITQMWMCSTTHRNNAHLKGFKKLSDVKDSTVLGYSANTKTGQLINRYLGKDYNTVNDFYKYINDADVWTTLDFEALSLGNITYAQDSSITESYVYLASMGDKQYGLTTLTNNIQLSEIERELARDLYNDLMLLQDQDPCFTVYCWGDAEARYMYKLEEKYRDYPLGSQFAVHLVNLHEIMSVNNIILPGQYDNSLSSVASAMGIQSKNDVNPNNLVEMIVYGGKEYDKVQLLETLLDYNRNDTRILDQMIQQKLTFLSAQAKASKASKASKAPNEITG